MFGYDLSDFDFAGSGVDDCCVDDCYVDNFDFDNGIPGATKTLMTVMFKTLI